MVDNNESDNDLRQRLKDAGIDYSFVQDVTKLEETKRLVKAGKVKKEVYQQLQEDVLRHRQISNASANSNSNNPSNGGGIMKRMFRRGNFKSDNKVKQSGRSRAGSANFFKGGAIRRLSAPKIQSSDAKRSSKPVSQALDSSGTSNNATGSAGNGLPILKDELLRLGSNKLGKSKWRKVFVVLYKDALEYFRKEGDVKPIRKIVLDDPNMDFFVSEVVGGVLKKTDIKANGDNIEDEGNDGKDGKEGRDRSRTNSSAVSDSNGSNRSEDVLDQPHLFLLSNLQQKYYFAAEDEVKKQYWVMMLTTVIRDIMKQREDAADKEDATTRSIPNAGLAKGPTGGTVKLNGDWDDVTVTRASVDPRTAEQIQKDFEARQRAYEQSQQSRFKAKAATLRPGDLEAQMPSGAVSERWKKQGDRVARQSVALDWLATERAQAQNFVREQELLKMEIKKKDEELKLRQEELNEIDSKWQRKYDDLLDQFRSQALNRRNQNMSEEARLRSEITTLKRMSVMPRHRQEEGRDYESEIEMYKTKLKALQAALNVDIENLDWDGTLDDAEKKMKVLIPDLMSPDPQIQQEAQKKFDQWDQIIRNHAEYISREQKKWESWESENFEKNLDALNEMRQIAPKMFFDGCTEEELVRAARIMPKTAARVKKNNIFRFFWMDKDTIAKIHIADLTNKYASQGLDLRELRAIYATLPDEFQIDSDGRKKQFRENLRNRLFELTEKEKNGTLSASEEMNNAYRSKDVREKPKIAQLPPGEKPRKVVINKNMKNKALALQAMLEKRGGGGGGAAPSKKPAPSSGSSSATEAKLDPEADEWKKYFRMKKAGLPDGAIMNGMQKDGKDPNLWFKLVDLKEKGSGASTPQDSASASAGTQTTEKKPADLEMTRNPMPPSVNQRPGARSRVTQKSNGATDGNSLGDRGMTTDALKARARKMLANSGTNDAQNTHGLEMQPNVRMQKSNNQRKKLQPKAPKRSTLVNNDGDIMLSSSDVGKSKKKKTLRTKKSNGKPDTVNGGNHMLMADADALVKRAQVDHDMAISRGGSHGVKTMQYGSLKGSNNKVPLVDNGVQPEDMSLSQKRAANMSDDIERSLDELVDIIVSQGQYDPAEGGIKTMRFIDLFLKYEKISDMLIGLLLKGKRSKILKYRGDMLFKGIHDDIKITVIKQR